MRLLLIAVGGAAGTLARYGLDGLVYRVLPPTFPYGTFIVNVAGCFVFGLAIGLAETRFVVGPTFRGLVLIGILGGFTTFSSFTYETFTLLRGSEVLRAAVNAIGQVGLGLAALWGGHGLARLLGGVS
jgi:CrcB protein